MAVQWGRNSPLSIPFPHPLAFWPLVTSNGSKVVIVPQQRWGGSRKLPKSDEKEDGREWRPVGFESSNFCLSSEYFSHKTFQLQGGLDPLTRGYAPEPRWGLCPQTLVIDSHCALSIVVHPTFLHLTTPLSKSIQILTVNASWNEVQTLQISW